MSGKPQTVEQHRTLSRARCEALVLGLVGSKELAKAWWTSANKAFDSATPEEVWQTDYETVYRYLMFHAGR